MEPMQPGRFLELLNKKDRTPEEEAALQGEILRQQKEAAAKEQPAKTEPTPPAPAQPATQPAATQPAGDKPYSISVLASELQDAIAYLKSQPQTGIMEMAISSLVQAAYWLTFK